MPINEDFSGKFFVKDSNGNWIPIGDLRKLYNKKLTGDIMITGEITLSDEAAAQWWATEHGGIEIVER